MTWAVKFHDGSHDHPVLIHCDEVDFKSMPLIYLRGIRQPHRSALIHFDESDEFKELSQFRQLIIQFGSLIYAGEIESREIRELRPVRERDESEQHGTS